MTLGMLAATIGFAGAASAAPTVWTMPDVKDLLLSQAVKAVEEATDSAELDLRLVDYVNGQDVYNETMWSVCSQNPAAGKAISQTRKLVFLYVKRFNQSGCWN